jgi:hypothetical protein
MCNGSGKMQEMKPFPFIEGINMLGSNYTCQTKIKYQENIQSQETLP